MFTRKSSDEPGRRRRVTTITEDDAGPDSDPATVDRDDTRDDTRGDGYATRSGEQEVVTEYADGGSVLRGLVRMFNMLVVFALLVVETLLAFRLVFALIGANAANNFVEFIYDVTGPLVAPFEGIASEELTADGVFEPETVIAMVVYAVAALLIIAFMSIIAAAPRTGPATNVVTRERHQHREEGA